MRVPDRSVPWSAVLLALVLIPACAHRPLPLLPNPPRAFAAAFTAPAAILPDEDTALTNVAPRPKGRFPRPTRDTAQALDLRSTELVDVDSAQSDPIRTSTGYPAARRRLRRDDRIDIRETVWPLAAYVLRSDTGRVIVAGEYVPLSRFRASDLQCDVAAAAYARPVAFVRPVLGEAVVVAMYDVQRGSGCRVGETGRDRLSGFAGDVALRLFAGGDSPNVRP